MLKAITTLTHVHIHVHVSSTAPTTTPAISAVLSPPEAGLDRAEGDDCVEVGGLAVVGELVVLVGELVVVDTGLTGQRHTSVELVE